MKFWFIFGKKCTKYLHGMILYPNDFWHKKIDNFDKYNVFLTNDTNILLKTAFVLQSHIYEKHLNFLL